MVQTISLVNTALQQSRDVSGATSLLLLQAVHFPVQHVVAFVHPESVSTVTSEFIGLGSRKRICRCIQEGTSSSISTDYHKQVSKHSSKK
jgi:predicted CoA-binding protein